MTTRANHKQCVYLVMCYSSAGRIECDVLTPSKKDPPWQLPENRPEKYDPNLIF